MNVRSLSLPFLSLFLFGADCTQAQENNGPVSVAPLVAAIGTTNTNEKPNVKNSSVFVTAAGSPIVGWYLRDGAGGKISDALNLGSPDFSQPGHPQGFYSAYTFTKVGNTWVAATGDQGCILPSSVLPKLTKIRSLSGAALKAWSKTTTFIVAATIFGTGAPQLQTNSEFLGKGQPPIFSLSYAGDQVGLPFRSISLDTALVIKGGVPVSQGFALRMSATSDSEPVALKKLARLFGVQNLRIGKFRKVKGGDGKGSLGEVMGAPLNVCVIRYGSHFQGFAIYNGSWTDNALSIS